MTALQLALPAFACIMFLGGRAHAQLTLDKDLHMTGPTPEHRQVTGLDPATLPTQALDAATELHADYRSVTATPGAWSFAIAALPGPPIPGTQLVVQVAGIHSGPIALTVNSHGPYPLITGPDEPVSGAQLTEGAMLSIVFDGANFQVLNGGTHGRRPCPAGTVTVNHDLCIAPEEHPLGATDFFSAILACHAEGLRLCSWSEWILGCTEATALGLSAMTNNWEWADDMVNEDGSARTVGGIQGQGCYSGGTSNATTGSRSFRCCYRR